MLYRTLILNLYLFIHDRMKASPIPPSELRTHRTYNSRGLKAIRERKSWVGRMRMVEGVGGGTIQGRERGSGIGVLNILLVTSINESHFSWYTNR